MCFSKTGVASRVMSRLDTRSIFHIEGMDNMYSNPITYWTSPQLTFFVGGRCFFVVGVGWFQIASNKNAQMPWLFDGFVGFNSWPFPDLLCVFFGAGFLILEAPGTVLVMFFFFTLV